MDEDLGALDRVQLIAEIKRLREAVREHRDSSGQALCWHHPKLWGLLPERSDPMPIVPDWPQFLRGCVAYRQSLDDQLPNAPRSSLEAPAVDPKLVVLRFNEAINARDLDRLVALMTEDHCFIDTADNVTRGREAMSSAWKTFFASFPDYRNEFTTITSRGELVLVIGYSKCSERALDGPAIWKANVRDRCVSEWRVYQDSDDVRRSLGL